MFISLEEAKNQCRVDSEYEDVQIQIYVSAAERACLAYLNRPVFKTKEELEAAGEDIKDGIVISEDIRVAMLLVIDFLYENRDDGAYIPQASRHLMDPYRKIPGL